MIINAFNIKKSVTKIKYLCLPLLSAASLAFSACDKKKGKPEPLIEPVAQGSPAPIASAQPTVDPEVAPPVVPPIVPPVAPSVIPQVTPTVTPSAIPTPSPGVSPTVTSEFRKSEIGLRLAPGMIAPIDGSGCDAIKLPSGTIVSENSCTADLINSNSTHIGIFWHGTWAGTLGKRILQEPQTTQPFPLLRITQLSGIVQYGATFAILVPAVNFAQNKEVNSANIDLLFGNIKNSLFLVDTIGNLRTNVAFFGPGSPRRTSYNGSCVNTPDGLHCSVLEYLVNDRRGKGKIGDLVVLRSLDVTDQALGFITGGLFDEQLRKEHGIQEIPWIVESF